MGFFTADFGIYLNVNVSLSGAPGLAKVDGCCVVCQLGNCSGWPSCVGIQRGVSDYHKSAWEHPANLHNQGIYGRHVLLLIPCPITQKPLQCGEHNEVGFEVVNKLYQVIFHLYQIKWP